MCDIEHRLQAVRERIDKACRQAQRPSEQVRLLAVSKKQPFAAIAAAYRCGQRDFGENYAQEGVDKIAAARSAGCELARWHFIGPIQSNKTRLIAENFDWVHSIERLGIAERLSRQRPGHLPPLQICVEVNVGNEASKSGCPIEETAALCAALVNLPNLALRGLMCIPPPSPTFSEQREFCARLKHLATDCAQFFSAEQNHNPNSLEKALSQPMLSPVLSMGMSDDLEAAIAEGATIVRVGTAIFGARLANQ